MKRKRAPYARLSVWYAVAAVAVVLIVGFLAVGYELNHLRNEINGLQTQVSELKHGVSVLYAALLKLAK